MFTEDIRKYNRCTHFSTFSIVHFSCRREFLVAFLFLFNKASGKLWLCSVTGLRGCLESGRLVNAINLGNALPHYLEIRFNMQLIVNEKLIHNLTYYPHLHQINWCRNRQWVLVFDELALGKSLMVVIAYGRNTLGTKRRWTLAHGRFFSGRLAHMAEQHQICQLKKNSLTMMIFYHELSLAIQAKLHRVFQHFP